MKKRNEKEIDEEQDAVMCPECVYPIEWFPEKIDPLLDVLNRVCLAFCTSSAFMICYFSSLLWHKEIKDKD